MGGLPPTIWGIVPESGSIFEFVNEKRRESVVAATGLSADEVRRRFLDSPPPQARDWGEEDFRVDELLQNLPREDWNPFLQTFLRSVAGSGWTTLEWRPDED